jgi:hypothetical protein
MDVCLRPYSLLFVSRARRLAAFLLEASCLWDSDIPLSDSSIS